MVRYSDILESSHAVARDFRDRAVENLVSLPTCRQRPLSEDIADYVLERRNLGEPCPSTNTPAMDARSSSSVLVRRIKSRKPDMP